MQQSHEIRTVTIHVRKKDSKWLRIRTLEPDNYAGNSVQSLTHSVTLGKRLEFSVLQFYPDSIS
jgi:hypothetical protein